MTRVIILACLLVPTAVLHVAIQNTQDAATHAQVSPDLVQLPSDFMGFRQVGGDVPVSEDVKAALQTSSILMRNYAAPNGWPIDLTIVHAEKTRRSLHFPEVCLVGQGWEIREQSAMPVGTLFMGKRIIIFRGDHQEAVLYWFKTGDEMTGSYFLNSYYWAKGQILFQAPSSSMIRVSTAIGPQGKEASFRVLEEFAAALAPILAEEIR